MREGVTRVRHLEHVLSVEQFSRDTVEHLFLEARQMAAVVERGGDQRLQTRILATLFFEPSTRTRLSFESAMLRLGGQVISSEMAAVTSSAAKGERIEDTIRIVEYYADAIVLRHSESGAATRAASVASVPILNAGDGSREHPTQALLDLFTIQQELGSIDDLTVAFIGDLRYGRAARSLALLLSLTKNCRVIFATPAGLEMSRDVSDHLGKLGVPVIIDEDVTAAVRNADVVYVTRIQKERFPSVEAYQAVAGAYQFGGDHLAALKERAIVMHPLPRVDEIDPAVDMDARAAYFRQARNGIYLRMALLDAVLGAKPPTA